MPPGGVGFGPIRTLFQNPRLIAAGFSYPQLVLALRVGANHAATGFPPATPTHPVSNPCPIFLSYAHEDAPAARAIADALRAFDLEVWFDQNELRGGDQWDAKIRGQIKACGLFIPLISATTESRDEAYFRLEWKLADDRSHLMAPGKAFVVPVVIDDTPEYEATVPDSFARAQWTRLAEGKPTPAFIEQIKRLATAGSDPGSRPKNTRTANTESRNSSTPSPATASAPRAGWMMPAGIVAALAAILAAFWLGRGAEHAATPEPATAAVASAPHSDRSSIAVLPFANMSEDPTASSFFADGVHEDLLTNLAYIGNLRVVSRTSVLSYKGTKKPVRQIGSELGVGTLLEGSVRRAGNRVRVTAQLIDATTDEHIWAETYDRELQDIFAIQAELAKSIAEALRIALTDQESATLARRPTENLAAYELLLRHRELSTREGNTLERVKESTALLQQAVTLDPDFAIAWAELATVYSQSYFWYFNRTATRLTEAEQAITRAQELAPDNLDVIAFTGDVAYYARRDYEAAAESYQHVLARAPNHVGALGSMGFIRRRQGRWSESIRWHERALSIDPRNVGILTGLVTTFVKLRDWDQALSNQQRILEIQPGDLGLEAFQAFGRSMRDNSISPLRDYVERYAMLDPSSDFRLNFAHVQVAMATRDWSRALELWQLDFTPEEDFQAANSIVMLNRKLGRDAEAMTVLTENLAHLRRHLDTRPTDAQARGDYIEALVLAGDFPAARTELAELKAHYRSLNDAFDGDDWRETEAMLLAWSGQTTLAVDLLREGTRLPGMFRAPLRYRNRLRFSPLWDTPEFEALMNDPTAWAPIRLN